MFITIKRVYLSSDSHASVPFKRVRLRLYTWNRRNLFRLLNRKGREFRRSLFWNSRFDDRQEYSFAQENESFWLRLVLLRYWSGAFLIMIVFARLIGLIWNQKQVIPGFNCIVSVEKFGLSKSLTALLVLTSIFHAVNSRANNWIPVARWQRATNKTAFELTTNIVGKRSSASGGEQC